MQPRNSIPRVQGVEVVSLLVPILGSGMAASILPATVKVLGSAGVGHAVKRGVGISMLSLPG